MDDYRASITLSMTLHGRTYTTEMWIIYWPNNEGIDNRIVEWFAACQEDARARFEARMADQRLSRIEVSERAELARLRAKYEAQGGDRG